jgi:PAS domain S-box-containing protein
VPRSRTRFRIRSPRDHKAAALVRALHAQVRVLRQREQRFRSVFQQQFQFMVILSPEGRVLEVNEQFPEQGGGVPRDEVIGKLFWDTAWWQNLPEARAAWPDRLRAAAEAGGPLRSEDQFHSASGELRTAQAAITAVRDEHGRLDFFIVQGSDVTEQRAAELQRRGLEQQLREAQKLEAIGTLAGGIAHDFNNLLGSIMGNVALAREALEPGSAARAPLDQIRLAGKRGRSLVQQILAFSRRQPTDMAVQPLQPLVRETIALMRSTLPSGVALDLVLPEAPVVVRADANHLQQVLVNLCTNAWHALQGQSGHITIGLDTQVAAAQAEAVAAREPGPEERPARAHLWVRDDGVGMSEATLRRVFEPFFTTKPAGAGTGLGLSVAHGIVTEHGGSISVDSAPGLGSTFHVWLPLSELPVDAAAPADSGLLPLQGSGQHVLYIDDDDIMIAMVDALLQRAGFRVTTCQDAALALHDVGQHPFQYDLVVTDFNMPRLSGIEVAYALAQIRRDLPVVISSGYLSEELRAEAQRAGVRALLQKENTLEELGALVQRLLADEPA